VRAVELVISRRCSRPAIWRKCADINGLFVGLPCRRIPAPMPMACAHPQCVWHKTGGNPASLKARNIAARSVSAEVRWIAMDPADVSSDAPGDQKDQGPGHPLVGTREESAVWRWEETGWRTTRGGCHITRATDQPAVSDVIRKPRVAPNATMPTTRTTSSTQSRRMRSKSPDSRHSLCALQPRPSGRERGGARVGCRPCRLSNISEDAVRACVIGGSPLRSSTALYRLRRQSDGLSDRSAPARPGSPAAHHQNQQWNVFGTPSPRLCHRQGTGRHFIIACKDGRGALPAPHLRSLRAD